MHFSLRSYPSLFGKQSVEGNEKSVADRRAASLSTFNFVLAIERNSINSNNNPSLVKMCSSIVKQVSLIDFDYCLQPTHSQLSTVAHYEENRCGFLRSDIVRLLNVRENWSNKLVTSKDKGALDHDDALNLTSRYFSIAARFVANKFPCPMHEAGASPSRGNTVG